MESNFYYFCMCHYCKKVDLNLKTCTSCKSLYYCSREHQQLDWTNHKQLCKSIKISSKLTNPPTTNISWQEHLKYRLTLKTLWQREIKRELFLFENQMWMFPKVCAACCKRENLTYWCEKCMNVVYCSEKHYVEHSFKHRDYCKQLKLCMEIDLYLRSNLAPIVKIKPIKCDISDSRKLHDFTTNLKTEILSDHSNETRDINLTFISSLINPIATILYCLENIFFINNRKIKRDTLTVHFIGSGKLESQLNWDFIVDFICTWIINLKKLNIILIGPEINDVIILGGSENFKNATINFKCFSDVYHKLHHELPTADVLVAFNCGLSEFEGAIDGVNDIWYETLPFLISDAPFILTGYTMHEIMRDLRRLNLVKDGVVLLSPRKNPYANCRPFRDFETEDQPVFCENGWVSVVKETPNVIVV